MTPRWLCLGGSSLKLFKGKNLLEFSERFKTDEDRKEHLAHIKWNAGSKFVKCNHPTSQIRKDFGRTCLFDIKFKR